jgi:hypothetical protein
MHLRALLFLTAASAALVAFPAPAGAVGTRTFELDSLEKLSGGDVKGVSIGSDGVVRAGWTLGSLPLPADTGSTVTCAVALADGSAILGTGPAAGGKIVRIVGDQATILADTKESAINALAVDRAGTIYAGTTSGRIYRVVQGKAQAFATLPGVDSVLSLAMDKAGTGLYAGTGSEGKVFHVDPQGASSVLFTVDDTFVVSLALAADGTLYAGTSGKGLLYRITAAGRGSVLFDSPGNDLHAIAFAPNGTLYAIVNEEPPPSSESESTTRHGSNGRTPPGPSSAPRTKPGKGALWRFDATGRPERMMHHDEFHYVSLAVDDRGVPYVGTGAEGRVYTVDDAHTVSMVADLDERQAGAIGMVGKTHFVVGSDPAVFHRVLATGGPDAVWTSKPLDAGLRARFGHLTWQGAGSLEVSTRSGDTGVPDGTWSAWQGPVAQGGAVPSPPARYVQVRARLRDAASTLSDVTLAFATDNLRAVVTDVQAHEKGSAAREAKEGLPPSGGSPPKHDNVVHVSWKVDNPDSDELRYRVQFRREGQARWLDATSPDDVLTKPELEWDTSALPEGKYRLRVDASDEIANPPGEATHHALESAPVRIDNTPPVVKSIGLAGRRLRAEVVDGVGPIARVEVAIDGRLEWRPISAADGIFDTADETIDADIGSLIPAGPGPHLVTVRAYDAAGNAAVREVEAP